MYPAALNKIPTVDSSEETVDSSQVFEKWILQNIQRWSTKEQKVGTEPQSAIWDRFVPNRIKISFLDCCRQRQFYLD